MAVLVMIDLPVAGPAGRSVAPWVRAVLLVVGLGAATWLLARVASERLPLLLDRGSDPSQLLVGVAAGGGALLGGWLLAALLLTALAAAPGALGVVAARSRDRVAPAVVRRWAALAVGLSTPVLVAPAATAGVTVVADEPGAQDEGAAAATPLGFTATDAEPPRADRPGWTPQRPTMRSRAQPGLVTGPAGPRGGSAEIVVRRGDSLWTVAARALGPDATDLEIAEAWPRWHAANRDVIGDDPDLIHPGTRLRAPSTSEETR